MIAGLDLDAFWAFLESEGLTGSRWFLQEEQVPQIRMTRPTVHVRAVL